MSLSRHGPSSGRKVDIQGQKQVDFNVSSAYVLKSDMDLYSPVDAAKENEAAEDLCNSPSRRNLSWGCVLRGNR